MFTLIIKINFVIKFDQRRKIKKNMLAAFFPKRTLHLSKPTQIFFKSATFTLSFLFQNGTTK